MALELLGRRGTNTFRRSSTFTMILYKLCDNPIRDNSVLSFKPLHLVIMQ
jgi:hypothetical protein